MARMLRQRVRCGVGRCMCCGKVENPRAKEKLLWEREAQRDTNPIQEESDDLVEGLFDNEAVNAVSSSES